MTKNGNKFIIVAIDYFTHWPFVHTVPHTTQAVIQFLIEDIISIHDCPQILISNYDK
ncbi:hypothetical protein H4R33_006950 [Dimargaris cristalligena]|nr:hypothetical protein H4R33_006950 [Dimargaris cristalligena]